MNHFTEGPCRTGKETTDKAIPIVAGRILGFTHGQNREADADFIAAAFNSATACAKLGYDGQKCVEFLSDSVKLLEEAAERLGWNDSYDSEKVDTANRIEDLLAKAKGEKS